MIGPVAGDELGGRILVFRMFIVYAASKRYLVLDHDVDQTTKTTATGEK